MNTILDQINRGVTQDMRDALTDTSLTRLEMHSVTQSYLLLQILDRLDKLEYIDASLDVIYCHLKDWAQQNKQHTTNLPEKQTNEQT